MMLKAPFDLDTVQPKCRYRIFVNADQPPAHMHLLWMNGPWPTIDTDDRAAYETALAEVERRFEAEEINQFRTLVEERA